MLFKKQFRVKKIGSKKCCQKKFWPKKFVQKFVRKKQGLRQDLEAATSNNGMIGTLAASFP